MEYNNYNQPNSRDIVCPQITVWVHFILFFLCLVLLLDSPLSFLAIVLSIQLPIALCVTIGIAKKYCFLYMVGLIISVIISILISLFLLYLIFFIFSKGDLHDLWIEIIVSIVLIWLQSGILLGYKKRVKLHCSNVVPQVQYFDDQNIV